MRLNPTIRARRLRLLVGALASASVMMLSTAGPASAHAVLLTTSPNADEVVASSPTEVAATFNEPVELAFGALRVFDTDAERVDLEDPSYGEGRETIRVGIPDDLAEGTYTATYRVVSADSHPVHGAFVFHVGAPGSQPEGIGAQLLGDDGGRTFESVFFTIVRAFGFASLLLLAGALFFGALVWQRTAAKLDPETDVGFSHRWRRIVVWSWGALLVATLLGMVLQASVAADVSFIGALAPNVWGELLGTRFGMVHVMRLLLLLAGAAVWFAAPDALRSALLSRGGEARSVGAAGVGRPNTPVMGWLVLLGAVLLLATPGLAGHAGVTEPVPLNVAADVFHMVAAAAWLGGLVLLLAGVFPATLHMGGERVRILAPIVSRFSDLAMVAVGVLVLTGIYRSWAEVQAWRALFEAPYGRVLLVKLAVFLPLLGLGAFNNRWTKPRLEQAASTDEAHDAGAIRALRRAVGVEVALGAVVVAVTAILVNITPARVEAGLSGPYVTDVRIGNDNLNLLVDPNQVGENLVHLTVTAPEGGPREVESMNVEFRMREQDIGPITSEGRELGPGHFVVQGHELSVPGEWELTITATFDEFTDARTSVTFEVNR